MKISICIPVYNVETYLKECLDSIDRSILQYQGSVSHEILMVDNASTDKSRKIAGLYVQSHPAAKLYVHKENRGIAASRNLLVSKSTGDYIAWVDSDDKVGVRWFSSIAENVSAFQPSIFAFEMAQFNESGESELRNGQISFGLRPGEVRRLNAKEYSIKVLQGLTIFDFMQPRVIQRSLQVRFPFRTPKGMLEDTVFAFDCLPHVSDVVYLSESLYCYRSHSDSFMKMRPVEAYVQEADFLANVLESINQPFRDAASVHVMSYMRRVMVAAAKNPNNEVLHTKAKAYKRFFWKHIYVIVFERYLPIRRRLADLLTIMPFSDFFLRRCRG